MTRPKVILPATSAEYINEVKESAEELLLARDRYVKAWVRWNFNALGCLSKPADEADLIKDRLEDAVARTDAAIRQADGE